MIDHLFLCVCDCLFVSVADLFSRFLQLATRPNRSLRAAVNGKKDKSVALLPGFSPQATVAHPICSDSHC
jgi:hypothetical protein